MKQVSVALLLGLLRNVAAAAIAPPRAAPPLEGAAAVAGLQQVGSAQQPLREATRRAGRPYDGLAAGGLCAAAAAAGAARRRRGRGTSGRARAEDALAWEASADEMMVGKLLKIAMKAAATYAFCQLAMDADGGAHLDHSKLLLISGLMLLARKH
mmetsp:Transcript_131083/g.365324  ORF Transcript_131083/g.365324 Transcript_131083/m.365324 type:complete len:155 (+) Transcript_131083:82-546(+)